ncbi:MAG: heme o synthase [Actinobacteria bacterium]|nr:heme o synthase [Actinomycetota bacterium]
MSETLPYTIGLRLRYFLALVKIRQTIVLLFTGVMGYIITVGLSIDYLQITWMMLALLLTISGCTALNMIMDRDIDALMKRTATRPLPSGHMKPVEAITFGLILSAIGLIIAFALNVLFGIVVFLGFVFDLLVYTAWLKRRTALSILFGGVAGGMPVLSGRVLALGEIDTVGLLLTLWILLWVPCHVLLISLRYADDYRQANVPVWSNRYGVRSTNIFITLASLLNTVVLVVCASLLQMHIVSVALLLAISLAVFIMAAIQVFRPDMKRSWLLFKMVSMHMLAVSLILIVGSMV